MVDKKLIALVSAVFTLSAWAHWQSEDVAVSFLTTKLAPQSSTVTETNTFSLTSATIDFDGKLRAAIDLDTLDTGIGIRDQRIQEKLFQAVNSGEMVITTSLNMPNIEALHVGEQRHLSQGLHITFGQIETDVTADLLLTRLSDTRLSVVTLKPIVLELHLLGVDQGINTLREIAGLEAIAMQAPVSINATFTHIGGG